MTSTNCGLLDTMSSTGEIFISGTAGDMYVLIFKIARNNGIKEVADWSGIEIKLNKYLKQSLYAIKRKSKFTNIACSFL